VASFTQKLLRVSLTLPTGNFSGPNTNTLVLNGFRTVAHLERTGNFTNQCTLSIYGIKPVDMNSVTVMFGAGGNIQSINTRAVVTVESNDGSGWLQIFQGQCQQAAPDYRNAPDVCLTLQASTGAAQQYLTASPTSVRGAADVAALAQQLATQMGFPFEDNGVTGSIDTPYLSGTVMDQFRELAMAANFDFYFDAKGTLIICPPNQGRAGKTPIQINAQSGQMGYVTLGQYGITVDVLFSPSIALGWPIQISGSQVKGTNGVWYPYSAVDDLEAVKPGGVWKSRLQCAPFSASAP
jgi:hypothetical protein